MRKLIDAGLIAAFAAVVFVLVWQGMNHCYFSKTGRARTVEVVRAQVRAECLRPASIDTLEKAVEYDLLAAEAERLRQELADSRERLNQFRRPDAGIGGPR